MSDPVFDILFFALLAAFVVYRLRSVLGKRTGHEKSRENPFSTEEQANDRDDNVIQLPRRTDTEEKEEYADALESEHTETKASPEASKIEGSVPDLPGVKAIQEKDSHFDPAAFLEGAQYAFEMIVDAFATGDREQLKPLLSDEVLRNFTQAIDERENRGDVLSTTLVEFKSVTLKEASLEGQTAFVTVGFVTGQINVVRDSDGKVVEGDVVEIEEIKDNWTFARNTRSSNPNWTLVATASEDDAAESP